MCMKVLLPAAVSDPNISVLVVGCFAALACTCHVLFGPAFGAAALLQVSDILKDRLGEAEGQEDSTSADARVAKSCIVFQMLLFSFGLLPGSVVFDIVRFVLVGTLSEVKIELALTILRFGGRSLRSECPEDFREVLKFVTSEVSEAAPGSEDSEIQSRLDFLLKELADLKNNKVSFTVMDRFNQTRGWLQTAPALSGKKVSDHMLAVPFGLLHEEVPNGWLSEGSGAAVGMASRKVGKVSSSKDHLRAAAIAQRLSSELRQNLFIALMGAEDAEDAAERVLLVASAAKTGIGEACIVLFHCAVREKAPNPFYTHVASTLCSRPAPAGKRFSHSMKRAAVQHMQQAHGYGMRAAVCLAELCAALVVSSSVALPLSIVRFMKFGGDANAGDGAGAQGLNGILGLLLRHMIESLIRRLTDAAAAKEVFAQLKKYEDVREGILLVLDGMVRPRLPPLAKAPELWEKLKAARREIAQQTRLE
eukprot:TRINITY_DN73871_c0_g1_i1.p1 TRINITY_DN73871_c0_g1~~TRINITY_DN73871_c0_g1_i1.p1  ORF type:complete len:491 (-),score=98.01 TRINITY_DN73871_c0_g1_i1:344-1777(-)